MENKDRKIVIAIDGFSSCGKSTVAKELAKIIGYKYIDTGAMYRAITLFCLENDLVIDQTIKEKELENVLTSISIDFRINPESHQQETYLDGRNVEKEIRTLTVSRLVSPVAALKFVREEMVHQQQAMGREKGVVLDGRDIGTVVFPKAELKIFMTADPKIRAERRFKEIKEKHPETTFQEVLDNVSERDHIDQNRKESPLTQAEDALVLDNSFLNPSQQLEWALERYNSIISPK